jgi:hypothetical protein
MDVGAKPHNLAGEAGGMDGQKDNINIRGSAEERVSAERRANEVRGDQVAVGSNSLLDRVARQFQQCFAGYSHPILAVRVEIRCPAFALWTDVTCS